MGVLIFFFLVVLYIFVIDVVKYSGFLTGFKLVINRNIIYVKRFDICFSLRFIAIVKYYKDFLISYMYELRIKFSIF